MKTLIIWCEIPEKIEFYIHPAMENEDIETIKLCNNQFLNLENPQEVDEAINELVAGLQNEKYFTKIDEIALMTCKPDLICVTGIIL